jgi:hypothetical protein
MHRQTMSAHNQILAACPVEEPELRKLRFIQYVDSNLPLDPQCKDPCIGLSGRDPRCIRL